MLDVWFKSVSFGAERAWTYRLPETIMQDVTLLLFLEPYAILLSADILGNICLWGGHVPPSCPNARPHRTPVGV